VYLTSENRSNAHRENPYNRNPVKEIKQAGADIFTFNEIHGDESNALARRVKRLSKQRMWKNNNEDCKIVHGMFRIDQYALVLK
jgi:hypothetical protein